MACVMMVKGVDSGTGPTPREMCGLGLRRFISLCLCVLAWKTRADDKPCTLGLLWGSGSSQTFDPQGVQAPREDPGLLAITTGGFVAATNWRLPRASPVTEQQRPLPSASLETEPRAAIAVDLEQP